MLEIDIPGRGPLRLERLVSDYNGTLAKDGILLPGVASILHEVAEVVEIYVVTADTFGMARVELENLPVTLTILPAENQDQGKLDYLNKLGAATTACMGNGRNDALMLQAAALGIALVEGEGVCIETLQAADVACQSSISALELFLNPKRLVATLRR